MSYNVTKLKVSSDHLKSNYESLSDMRNDFSDNANAVMSIVESMKFYWQGPAYEAFRNSMINGAESLKGLSSYMDNFLDAYSEADKIYKNTERKVYNYVHDLKF